MVFFAAALVGFPLVFMTVLHLTNQKNYPGWWYKQNLKNKKEMEERSFRIVEEKELFN